MIVFAYYLFKVIICSGILYGYYLLTLRNRIFHHWNRYYLLATVLLSLLLPLISIPIVQEVKQTPNEAVRILEIVTTGDAYVQELNNGPFLHITTEQILVLSFTLISLFSLFVMIRTIVRINKMIRQHNIQTIEDFFFVNTSEKGTPFSFLRYIFWHEDIQPESAAGQHILKHEIAHVREKHTHDKLFLNGVLIVYWCNPFFWLIRREMAMIHEFIADKQSVDQQDTAAFAAMILHAAYPRHQFVLTNNFFHSPIKRRLKMLIKSQNSRVTYITRLLALPLVLLVIAAFTLKPSRINETNSTINGLAEKKQALNIDGVLNNKDSDYGSIKDLTSNNFQKDNDQDTGIVTIGNTSMTISTDDPQEEKRLADKLVVINGKTGNMAKLINKTVEADSARIYPENDPAALKLYGEPARNGVTVFYNARVLDIPKNTITKDTLPGGIRSVVNISIRGSNPDVLYIVDGVMINKKTGIDALDLMIKPEDIASIHVIKEKAALDQYGEQGKNGVVIITTKK
jgi:beta-lactamase regulating signal transducer with metallopeptidase domain